MQIKLKGTSVHITPRAIPCTATYEAASTVEVWSLCSPGSTCTETRGVDMNYVTNLPLSSTGTQVYLAYNCNLFICSLSKLPSAYKIS